MTHDASQLDLSQLAVKRQAPSAAAPLKRRRSFLTKYVLPGAILCGFAGLFGWAARDTFLPAQAVTVTPVVVSRTEIKQEGSPLFQAAGWVEPRPTPIVVSALAPGVIDQLLVISGQRVKKDEAVATLIDADAKIALAEAKARHAIQVAELARAEAALETARVNVRFPRRRQAELADAEALLAQTQRELNNLPFAVESAQTRLELARETLRRKELAKDVVPGAALRSSHADYATAETAVKELTARRPTLEQQIASLTRRCDALRSQLELLTEEKRELADAEANLEIARARLDQSRLAVDLAELTLNRMVIRSPINGCVLSLDARPGQWLAGAANAGQRAAGEGYQPGSSAVVGLYDPRSLQVRVDVRLEDVPQVLIGQPAQIETAALGRPIAGEVVSVTTQADIQKNTLQVKVAVTNPPEVIKPEMLAKVTFLAPPSPVATDVADRAALRLFVPRSLVAQAEGAANVWVANLTTGVAEQKAVELGGEAAVGGLVEVVRGLTPTDKLIVKGRDSLTPGMRIQVTPDEQNTSTQPALLPSLTAVAPDAKG